MIQLTSVILNAGDHSCLEPYLTRTCHLWKIMYQKHENVRVWRFYHNTRLCVVFHPFCKWLINDISRRHRWFGWRLYDPKGNTGSALNWPHVDSSLIRLPPCEATFKQHELRTSLQTKIWMNAHEARAVEFSRGQILFKTHTTPTAHWFPFACAY
jgi:hypothetical protein